MRRGPIARIAGIAVLVPALAAMSTSALADHNTVELVTEGTAMSVHLASTSADGSRVFLETAEALVAEDGDSSSDVYERAGGVTTLVSDRVQAGADAAVTSSFAGASADGSRVFFYTSEPLVAEDGDSQADVYERAGGVTTLVSDRVQAGADAAASALFGDASADGSRVFFDTTEPLVAEDGDSSRDVYQRAGGVTTLVSDRVQAGADAAATASFGAASADGSRVFFETTEALVAEDGDSAGDVYERSGGVTTLASDRVQAGADAAVSVRFGDASADGSRVFFDTTEPLMAEDGDSVRDVYQRAGGVTTLVSDRVQAGADAAVTAMFVHASADGSRVFFTTAEPLVAGDGDSSIDIYERAGGVTTLVSDRVQAGADAAIGPTFAGASADGSRVFFETREPLVAEDGDSSQDIYERAGGVTTLVSDRVQAGADAAVAATFRDASADGSRVFFETIEALVAEDGDGYTDVYERAGGTTTLVSDRVQAGADAAVASNFAGASADGSRVFFETSEALVASDGDSSLDIYLARFALPAPDPDSDGDGISDSSDACAGQSDLAAPRTPRTGCPADPVINPPVIQPPPDATAGAPTGCFTVTPAIRKRTKLVPGGGEATLTVSQTADPAVPLKITVGARRGVKLGSTTFKVNKKTLASTSTKSLSVPLAALKIGKRNAISVVVTLTNNKKVTVNDFVTLTKCELPPVTCERLAGGARLKCSSSMPLRARRVTVTVFGADGKKATSSAPVTAKKGAKKGSYTLTMKTPVAFLPGRYVYKHVATTTRKGEKLLAVRVLILK